MLALVSEGDSNCGILSDASVNFSPFERRGDARVAKAHEGRVGVYGAVLIEGTVRPGDEVRLLN